ncbi:hypothetical protein CSOJ01_14421 [Colletotrichum sojae]|uniref:Ankyrin repeat protein n=1 Tax=Colletotrichum sojae TaxID=2175907 RepID=A0A8H6IQX4_9PEZI|nr:hypothetical protein CSOJ01_14421 [Colletotrichum sojae]
MSHLEVLNHTTEMLRRITSANRPGEAVYAILRYSGAIYLRQGTAMNRIDPDAIIASQHIVGHAVPLPADQCATGYIPRTAEGTSTWGDAVFEGLLLLEKGAVANAEGGDFGNALQAATIGGHQEIVQLLLENGADVNAQGGHYSNALYAASDEGHQEIVQLLLTHRANVS